jgi:hypothetical protein
MGSAGSQQAKTRQQIQGELLENVRCAKAEFERAMPEDLMAARESYVRALDALNMFLRNDDEASRCAALRGKGYLPHCP